MKNALQEQLLKAGLVDKQQAKKLQKQQVHAQRTGSAETVKQEIAQQQATKHAKDQALNQNLQQQAEFKSRQAAVKQMLSQHHIHPIQGDVAYQFVDNGKVKKIYLTSDLYKQVSCGVVAIAKQGEIYRLIPRIMAEKIASHAPEAIIVKVDKADASLVTPEDDPYAAYVIPDDLMW